MRKKPRLSEFIKEKLEKGEIPGLIYTNKDKQIFQIPWKHGAKQNYDIQIDGIIYVEWAKATNKYKKYFDKPNVWKTNFRCAINSLQDVKCLDEEEDKVNGKLRSDKEYRTFQFITPEKKKINIRTSRNTNKAKPIRQNTQSASLRGKKKKYKTDRGQEIQAESINTDANLGSVKTESGSISLESTEGSVSNSIDEHYHESTLPLPIVNPPHDQINFTVPNWNTTVISPIDHLTDYRMISQDENQDTTYRYYDLPEPSYTSTTCDATMGQSLRSNPDYQEILSDLRPSDTYDDYRTNLDRWCNGDNTRSHTFYSTYLQNNVPVCQSGY